MKTYGLKNRVSFQTGLGRHRICFNMFMRKNSLKPHQDIYYEREHYETKIYFVMGKRSLVGYVKAFLSTLSTHLLATCKILLESPLSPLVTKESNHRDDDQLPVPMAWEVLWNQKPLGSSHHNVLNQLHVCEGHVFLCVCGMCVSVREA